MECSICQEAINQETGQTTLSCQHSFHFGCISQWFVRRAIDDEPQECPYCRNQGRQEDRFAFSEDSEDEEEEDDEDDGDDESESASEMDEDEYETRIIVVRRRRDAQRALPESESASEMDEDEYETRSIVVRRRRDVQRALPESQAASKIQAAFRGFTCRRLLSTAMALASLRS